ncbi:MAG TPA: transcription termination/antitermination NusG family protein [Bryobacteraceae bacterium]|jgi:transcription antitermination factor NusG|nr:transcription termination/antitermination NusG family protein [Bryobacteraceae bacterium]
MATNPVSVVHPWYALSLRAGRERLASAALTGMGYEMFRPTRTVRRRWSDRVKQFEDALFPGYAFCRFDAGKRLPILTAPGVVSIVGIGKRLLPVDEAEIEAIRRLVASGLPLYPTPFLHVGRPVRIEEGALAGIEGILTEVRNRHRVVASISLLQRSVAVEIDPASLRAL